VGLVKTHKYYNLREPPRPFFYAPFAQTDTPAEIAIGIRMALGAQSTDVLGMVIRKGMVLTAAGILLGALAALAATRLMAGMLVNMSPADPLVFADAALFLGLVALPASYIPAKLAAKVDPMIALRCQ
jgi:putative ABC transport system permease protein